MLFRIASGQVTEDSRVSNANWCVECPRPKYQMRGTRRDFFTLLGATAWPCLAVAEEKLPGIGYLGATTRAVENRQVTAFLQGLHDRGWDDGRNIAIHFRW